MTITDAPDWQKVVVTVASGGVTDAPDWQETVVTVPSTGTKQDFPDWQHTVVGPGGTPVPIPPTPPDTYNGLIKYYNPLWWYKLDDAAGSASVVDSSAYAVPGTIYGGVTLGVSGPMGQTAASFDGSTGVILGSAAPPLWAAPYTIIAWFNTTATSFATVPELVSTRSGSNPSDLTMDLRIADASDFSWEVWSAYGSLMTGASGTAASPFNNGAWHMVAGVVDVSTNCWLYLDGVLLGSIGGGNTLPSLIISNDNNSGVTNNLVDIGNYSPGGSQYYQGSMAQVAGLPVALSATEVAKLWSLA